MAQGKAFSQPMQHMQDTHAGTVVASARIVSVIS